ncbi:MAG: Uma2 family endonuclease [Acidobacteriota bacterium]|nr:Uma2 family endonuclease [Acidobacteriota bacterium]
MTTAPSLTSIDEYMRTSYSPDCEYVDGVVVERNVGQTKHAYTQTEIVSQLRPLMRVKSLFALVEQRVRVSPSRVRIPDVCVIGKLDEEVITEPPPLCVEVLSPDDRWTWSMSSVSDYLEMQVPCVWVVDPYRERAWIFEGEQPPLEVSREGLLRAGALGIEISLTQVLPPSGT